MMLLQLLLAVCVCVLQIERERGKETLSSVSYGMKPWPFVCGSPKVKLWETFQTGHNTVHLPEHISPAFYYQEISPSCSHSLAQRSGPVYNCIF